MHSVQNVIQSRNLVTATPDTSVHDVALLMTQRGVGAISILENGHLVGIFSERDLMTRVFVPGRDPKRTPVSEVMTRDVVTAQIDDRTNACTEKMRAQSCRHLPVMAGNKLVAMLSMRDLLRDEIEESKEEIRHLRDYLHQQGPH